MLGEAAPPAAGLFCEASITEQVCLQNWSVRASRHCLELWSSQSVVCLPIVHEALGVNSQRCMKLEWCCMLQPLQEGGRGERI